jgi:hypothetical protein
MSITSVVQGLINDVGKAKRKLPVNSVEATAVYKRLHQVEGILNGALNAFWRASAARGESESPKK